MPKESETTGLNDGCKWWLVGNATDVGVSDKVVCNGCKMVIGWYVKQSTRTLLTQAEIYIVLPFERLCCFLFC